MLDIYGIQTCDTCRKARKWLDQTGIAHRWHDLRATVPARETIETWLREVGDAALINRRSTTWRSLSESDRATGSEGQVVGLLSRHPTLIKRPVWVRGGQVRVGFDEPVRAWVQS